MSIIARLIESGVDADLIEEVAVLIAERNILAGRIAAAPTEKARSTGALRTQRYRERKAAEASLNASQNVTCDASDANCDDVTEAADKAPTLPLSPNDLFSNPQTPTHPDNIPTREAVPFDEHIAAWQAWLASKAKGGKRAASSDTPGRPDDVSEQVWSDFLKHRRKHKADLTATALAGFRREADRVGWPLEQAIEESILRNWRGFKADWVKTNDRNGYGNSGFGSPAGSRFQPEGGIAEGLRRIELARNHGPSGEAGRWDDCEPEGGYLGSGS